MLDSVVNQNLAIRVPGVRLSYSKEPLIESN